MKGFGVAARETYDSKKFYERALYSKSIHQVTALKKEGVAPVDSLDTVTFQDSRAMRQLPDCSVHLMITSPPYNVGKDYDENLSLEEYRLLLRGVLAETFRVLVAGGRACINIANVGRKPYIALHRYIIEEMEEIGFSMRGEIIWDKSASAGSSTAWGSWKSASNPTLRDVHEYILIFSKGAFQRHRGKRTNSISRDQFLQYTKSVWTFPAESAIRVKHPAPFPLELPHRLIQLYSFDGEVVLDPFAGSGTTCVAALKAGRHFIGFDSSREYVKIARQRIAMARKKLHADANLRKHLRPRRKKH